MTFVQRLTAEGLGSALLTATVVGSGIMAQNLADGNNAVALLANTGATVAVLAVLIRLFAPISGAHFNPAVSLVMMLLRRQSHRDTAAYVAAQIIGCCAGTILAHVMFSLPLVEFSTHERSGFAQYVSEFIATFGLILVILGHKDKQDTAWIVAAWIGAAYWFTASTSFANPAITIARSLSDTFAGIRPADVAPFILFQVTGAITAIAVARTLFR